MNDLFSMYAKYFGKLTFLTLRYAHILIRNMFSENFGYVLNGLLYISTCTFRKSIFGPGFSNENGQHLKN